MYGFGLVCGKGTEINLNNFTLSTPLVIPALNQDPHSFAIGHEIPAQGRDDEGGVLFTSFVEN